MTTSVNLLVFVISLMFYGKLTYGKNVIWQRISIKFGPLGLDVTFYRPAVFAEHGGRLS